MKNITPILILILLIINCSSHKAVKKKGPLKKGLINENFNPLILKDDDLKINKKKTVEAKSNFDDSIISNLATTSETESEVMGYRVQICAVSDETIARDIQRDAILKFNEGIYLIYDSPYYKVRIGDCKTRYEADKLQQLAVQKGFDDAWVVKTKIKPRPKSGPESELEQQ